MNKGLEALKNIKREAGIPYFSTLYDIDMWREDFATVETELKRLEELETQRYLIFNGARGHNKELIRAYEKQNEILRIIKEHWTYCDKGLVQIKPISMENADLLKEWLK